MKRYLVKSVFGINRDFAVYDETQGEAPVYKIDGKMAMGLKAEIQDAAGAVLYEAKAKLIQIPKKMIFTNPSSGAVVATLTKHFSPIKAKLSMELADGSVWRLEGNFIGKNYKAHSGDTMILNIDQKWATIRDKYYIEVDESVDVALLLGMVWAVDAWREDNKS